jgi:hypothetical protein
MRPSDAKVGNLACVTDLGSAEGILAGPEHLTARREGAVGLVVAFAETNGQDSPRVVWVKHGRTTAPYWDHELTLQGVPE